MRDGLEASLKAEAIAHKMRSYINNNGVQGGPKSTLCMAVNMFA